MENRWAERWRFINLFTYLDLIESYKLTSVNTSSHTEYGGDPIRP